MKLRHKALLTLLAVVATISVIGAAPALAAPIWNLDIHHNETNFTSGALPEFSFDVQNLGDTDSSGPVTLSLNLPAGITRNSVRLEFGTVNGEDTTWSCPGSPGDTTVTCVTTDPIVSHRNSRSLLITVNVAPGSGPNLTAAATISGGGAPEAPPAGNCPPGVGACASEPIHVSADAPPFGVAPGSWIADFYEADGVTPVRGSGSHPDLARFSFDFNSIPTAPNANGELQKVAVGSVRHVQVDLPPGFLGNPTAVGECTAAQVAIGGCSPSSLVGRAEVTVFSARNITRLNFTRPVFNMAHPRGVVSDLMFQPLVPVHVKVSLDPANGYSIRSASDDVNETLRPFSTKVTLWGIPGDSSHETERCLFIGCSGGQAEKPFLTVPFRCDVNNRMKFSRYDSWQESGVFGPDVFYDMPGQQTDCEDPRFEPEVSLEPTGKQATTPTGLDVNIHIPQNENPNGLATPPVASTVVTLPRGMSFSPSFADGLEGCSEAQIGLKANTPVSCPGSSRIGEVELSTPLLPKPVVGSMYLAAQGANPFGSLFAVYLVVQDTEDRGVLVKIPGKIEIDPTTGQITTSFEELPQFPFEDLTLKFRSGSRAPLVNPPTCGMQTIGVQVTSYAQPNVPIDASNTYQVTEGPNGSPCPPDSARRPFSPKMSGGTLNPSAGTYSPFIFRLNREDSEQELSQVTTVLPPGLVAKIAGISACPDAVIASISSAAGAGVGEAASPACPGSSQIGSISAGLGAGPGPNYFPGKVFLAGPYKGAPLSLAIVAPGLAGPFDLGNVVVRAAIQVDHSTAQVTAVSDPFPTILHGVILRVRDVRLRMDRPNTTLNPTSCKRMAVNARISGVGGDLLSTGDDSLFLASNPFQVGDCASLSFKPNLRLQLFGGTKRGAHPKFRATLRMPQGGANIGGASVALPHSEFLDQSHIRTVCTRVQFAANQCPAGSVYGTAVAKTPLFSEPLSGPVYLRSSSNPLPDMVAVLKGPAAQPIEVELSGRIDSVNGGIRNTFDVVPDAPVETFTLELQGGKKGLLVNSRNLCKSVNRANAKFTGQNGAAFNSRPILQNSCKKPRRKAAAAKAKAKSRQAASRTIPGRLPAAF